ncbi:MAG TPA: hypothetical protein PL124_09655 [Candidatus Cloacimonadota bacterium]|nr:hypothetical protein [Candidatus Cloacimonadota bacterium]
MKKIINFIVLMVLFIGMGALFGETLKIDNNGVPIQLSRYFTTVKDTIPAQAPTVVDSIAVPTNAAEVIIVARHNAIYIRPNATTSAEVADASLWIYVPKDTPFKLPVIDMTYLCYRSATGEASINITWLRM